VGKPPEATRPFSPRSCSTVPPAPPRGLAAARRPYPSDDVAGGPASSTSNQPPSAGRAQRRKSASSASTWDRRDAEVGGAPRPASSPSTVRNRPARNVAVPMGCTADLTRPLLDLELHRRRGSTSRMVTLVLAHGVRVLEQPAVDGRGGPSDIPEPGAQPRGARELMSRRSSIPGRTRRSRSAAGQGTMFTSDPRATGAWPTLRDPVQAEVNRRSSRPDAAWSRPAAPATV